MKQVVFIDRDGTINHDRGYIYRVDDFEFLPGVLAALQALTRAQKQIIIVTNQAGIARGLYTEEDYHHLTQYMLQELAEAHVKIEGVFHCPHHPDGSVQAYTMACLCRKPNPGMLEQGLKLVKNSAAQAVMIGDKNSDIEAGLRLNMTTYLVETGYGKEEKSTTQAHYVVADLRAAVQHLLGE
ncbi:MAG: D-glycero-beta-D-manno-heptose 1,7-bisphosphate 7-phosphatase [Deltaproteobacteria bacterium]|nr:D-glycero-beta-D-manno-heptose 1,7-bisphosphate 7-phosphatase [Deltaproteobacteria bacterium]